MRAFVTIPVKDDQVVHKSSPVYGLRLPYLTQNGFPLFTLDSEPEQFVTDDWVQVYAFPGMVGVTSNGQMYVVDKDEEPRLLEVRVITQKEYERFIALKESFRQEARA